MVDWIARYRERVRRGAYPVRADVAPGYLFKLLPDAAPERGESWDAIMADIDRCIVPGLTHWFVARRGGDSRRT